MIASVLTLAVALVAPGPLPHRVAVLVGANQPGPGRRPLAHAHRDAEQMAEVLAAVGRFRADRIHVLRDPAPADLLALLQRAGAQLRHPDSLLYFYYSGHADESALYPAGQPLPFASLRAALDGAGASVRVGLVDACRGGAWTRTKGLTAEPPFEVPTPVNLGNEGSVLIASSSGAESAHESDALQGSFFTHHFVAALRGAGDRSGNGEVTLTEAFEYAKERTVRDTARVAREPQHPSYAVNLRGRQDLVLAQLATSPSSVLLSQDQGPLDLIQLDTGLSVLELAPGSRRVRLALRPGRYLVRRPSAQGNFTREVTVGSGGEVRIDEAELVLVGAPGLLGKGDHDASLLLTGTTLPGRTMALSASFGLHVGWKRSGFLDSFPEPQADARVNLGFEAAWLWAITDRLTWALPLPAFAYRFGDRDGWEVVPAGGLFGLGFSSVEGTIVQPGLHLGVRRRLRSDVALTANAGAVTEASNLRPFRSWQLDGAFGVSRTVVGTVTFNLSAGAYHHRHPNPSLTSDTGLRLGSVQRLALRNLPLLEWHVGRGLAVDLHVRVERSFSSSRWRYSSLGGLTYVF